MDLAKHLLLVEPGDWLNSAAVRARFGSLPG